MSYPRHLKTARLTLRQWCAEDADDVAAIWADPAVWQSLRGGESSDPATAAAAAHQKQVDHWQEHGFGLWLATLRDAPYEAPIGWVGAWYPDFVPTVLGEVEVGWTLRSSYWARGLAVEGARMAVFTAFSKLAVDRVISLIAPGNDRSTAVARRLGMCQHGKAETTDGLALQVFAVTRHSFLASGAGD
ncbi:MAG: GNAT family N-acetyltransferase [Solirubrobacterales bacterium]